MSFVKIWIHAVWGTKNHSPFLRDTTRVAVFKHIRENAISKGLHIDFINGVHDHVHVLMTLNADLSVSKTLNLIKGEASHWINEQKLIPQKFEWADEYFAASLSFSRVPTVRNYIRNQQNHHKKETFEEEYQRFIRELNLSTNENKDSE